MQNIIIGGIETIELPSDVEIFSRSAYIMDKKLFFDNKATNLDFIIPHISEVGKYFILFEKSGKIFIINRNTGTTALKEIEKKYNLEIGIIVSAENERFCCFTTENTLGIVYPDYQTIYCIEVKKLESPKITLAETTILVQGIENIFIYDFNLDLLGELHVSAAASIVLEEWNKVVCSIGKSIKFIEPNGLEHGEAIPVNATSLGSLKLNGNNILVVETEFCIVLYYMKNFKWYQKLSFKGKLVYCEKNILTIKEGCKIHTYILNMIENSSAIIDGKNVYIYNFPEINIPPPCYFKNIKYRKTIELVYIDRNDLYIVSDSRIYLFQIGKDLIFKKKIDLSGIAALQKKLGKSRISQIEKKNKELIIRANDFIYNINGTKEMEIDGTVDYLYIDNECVVLTKNGDVHINGKLHSAGYKIQNGWKLSKNTDRKTFLELSEQLQRCIITEEPQKGIESYPQFALLDGDGNLYSFYKKQRIEDLDTSYEVLHIEGPITSYTIYKKYILLSKKNKIHILKKEKILESLNTDQNFSILKIEENRIIGESCFGSIDIIKSVCLTEDLINKSLQEKDYKMAMRLSGFNQIHYEKFYLLSECNLKSLIKNLSSSDLVRVFQPIRLEECGNVYHEYDILEIGGDMFHPDIETLDLMLRKDPSLDIGLDILKKKKIIYASSVNHLLKNYKTLGKIHSKNKKPINYDKEHVLRLDEDPIISLNKILKQLNTNDHLLVIIKLLERVKRTDISCYLDTSKNIVEELSRKIPQEEVIKSVFSTGERDLIEKVYIQYQLDPSDLQSFFSWKVPEFRIYDFIGKRSRALYYLMESEGFNEECKVYIQKYSLQNFLLFYEYHGIFNLEKKGYKYLAEAETENYEKKMLLFILARQKESALQISREALLWKRSFDISRAEENIKYFIDHLENLGRYHESGCIYREYLNNPKKAFLCFLRSTSLNDAVEAFRNFPEDHKEKYRTLLYEKIHLYVSGAVNSIRTRETRIQNFLARIKKIEEGFGSDLRSQTVTTRSSIKSIKRALLRDRPGSPFELEYVLNQIRIEIEEISNDGRFFPDIFEWNSFLNMEKEIQEIGECRKLLSGIFTHGIEHIWEIKHPDNETIRPVIDKPKFPSWI